MAIIQKIRNRAGLLVAIIIGMALVAFILGDFLTSGGVYFSQKRAEVVKINGKAYSFEVYNNYLNEMMEIAKSQSGGASLDDQSLNQVRQQAWRDFVSDKVLNREFKRLGIDVPEDEMVDLIAGEQPHYIVRQIFTNPKTGILDRNQINNFLSTISQVNYDDPNKKLWLYYEDIIYRDRRMTKYQNLIRQGLYATTLETNRYAEGYNKTVDFNYLVKRFNEIPDSSITVTDGDLNTYYKEHLEDYKQDESRNIRYMVWEVLPSDKDYSDAENWIKSEYKGLVNEPDENSMQYVKSISDVAPNFNRVTKDKLTYPIDSFAFSAKVGDVYGPYFENEAYKLAKLTDIIYVPDSVKASHILFHIGEDNYANRNQIKAKADSIMDLIKSGKASFAAMAKEFSDDKSNSEKGGELEWFKEGAMVQPFSDSCFLGKKGDIVEAFTQYGIHIIKIEAQSAPKKQVKVAVLTREVRPSEETDQKYYSQAGEFGAKNNTREKFDEAIKNYPANLRYESGITKGKQNIGNMEGSRELIRWAYTANVGDVTDKVYQFDNKYVVAILDQVKETGYATLEEVKNIVELEVKKQKKAEKISSQIDGLLASTQGLTDLATNLNTDVKTATNMRFNNSVVPGLGSEPKLIAVATNLEEGTLSKTISGTNGVYVIEVTHVAENENTQTTSFEKSNIERGYSSRLYNRTMDGNTKLMATLNTLAKVEDDRIKFY